MKTTLPEPIVYSVPGKKITIPVYIGHRIFNKIKSVVSLSAFSSVMVILDENVNELWGGQIRRSLGENVTFLVIKPGEKSKSLATVEKIWMTLSKNNCDRKSLVINIGGGVVCDIGAFAASTYMRGISFVQIPTTLLAQADAAIGGKTGFNFNGLKNTIGTFSAPVAVISDTAFLSTLPPGEFRSGFAEIIKHAIISYKSFFEYLLNNNFAVLNKQTQIFVPLLKKSTTIKCEIVRKDPFEKKERKKLNFGHTVGHAVEMACYGQFLHGEAVAIGMIAEARMSFLSGHLAESKFKDIENLVTKTKLPTKVSAAYKREIVKKMLSDKKNVGMQIKWVFLQDIGNVKVDVTLPDEIVEEGLNYILR